MLLPFKKQSRDSETQPAEPLTYFDFIPYYCHHNPHTLLTKNGELLQIIRITTNARGLEYEGGDTEYASLRDIIRQAITHHVTSDNISLWIHTFRKRRHVQFGTEFKENFAGYVHTGWQQKHRWTHQYYNEIYITVLHDGQGAEMLGPEPLKHITLPDRNRAYRHAYIDKAYAALDTTVSAIAATIGQHYNAQRLATIERVPAELDPLTAQTVFYSEPMEFLGLLLNLRTEPFRLPDLDVSVALHTHDLTFGFNALETKNAEHKRRFAALLTLKQYCEMPSEAIDHLMQAPMEVMVCEAFHFLPEKEALRQYREQKELFQISGDSYSIKASGIEDMLAGAGKPLAYGSHQTSMMVIVDDYKQLDAEVGAVQNACAKLGLITVREDIKLEECFWAQLPGNFEFLRRKEPILTSRIGGFCRLNRFPGGTVSGNHWGEAVSLLPTSVGSPYFFNFHHRDTGHSVLFDFNSFNDPAGDVLLNFLLSETRKYDGKLFIFDRHKSAELFFGKLGGKYHRFAPGTTSAQPVMLNPFWLDDSRRDQSFLLAWCVALASPFMVVTDAHKDTLRQALAALALLSPEERNLSGLIAQVTLRDPALASAFSHWHGNGQYTGLLDATGENLDLRRSLHAFDMDAVVEHAQCIIPLFSYLLHRIVTTIDGRPTIIVLHEAWDLLENAFFAPRLESLLEMLQQSNVMVIFTTKKPQACVDTHVLPTIMRACVTHLYIPDDIALNYTSDVLQLTAKDSRMLLKMERQKNEFLLKQNHESIGLRAGMEGLDDLYAIFSNNIKNLMAAGGPYATLQDTPQG